MAREFHVSYDLVKETAKIGRLPVVNFAAGGIATPADAAYLMSLGCDGSGFYFFIYDTFCRINIARKRNHDTNQSPSYLFY